VSHGFIGVLVADLRLEMSESLKDKRRALQRLRAELVKATGASVTESDAHDRLRRAELTIAVTSRDAHGVSGLLDDAERVIGRGPFDTVGADRAIRSAREIIEEGETWHA